MDTTIVLAVDLRMFPGDLSDAPRLVDTSRISELVFNVQISPGTPYSPNPVRPSANAGSTLNLGPTPNVLFIKWPYELPGDSVAALSASVLYDPPKPGDPWRADTLYPPGSVVAPTTKVAHYFQVDHGGQPGPFEPDWTKVDHPSPADSDCNWTWIAGAGASLPQAFQSKQKMWLPGITYTSGDIIQGPASTQLFIMNKSNSAFTTGAAALTCVSGAAWDPAWNIGNPHQIVTDRVRLASATESPVTLDGDSLGGVLWVLDPNKSASCTPPDLRQNGTFYDGTKSVCVPDGSSPEANGRWYNVSRSGTSGAKPPAFNTEGLSWKVVNENSSDCKLGGNLTLQWQANTLYSPGAPACDKPFIYAAVNHEYSDSQSPFAQSPVLQWYDAGPTPPSTVTGALAIEQSLASLPTISLPQSHSRYSYNIASGVLVTTLRTKSFGYAPASSSLSTNSGTVIQTGSTLLIDPVISLTKYFVAFDSEKKWSLKDLMPGLTLSISLTSASNNFYIGGSSEIARYIQLEYGYVAARLPQPAKGVFVPSSSTTPPTNLAFHSGAYIGLSFNFSSFIPGAGGSGGGSGGGSSGKGGSGSASQGSN